MTRVDLINKTLIFLHLPKAGGHSLQPVIVRHYRQDQRYEVNNFWDKLQASIDTFRRLPDERKRQIGFVGGHVYFGLHKSIPKRSVYISFMREPIERTVSNYYFMKSLPIGALKRRLENLTEPTREEHDVLEFLRLVEPRCASLEDYIDLCVDLNRVNLQTRMIGGFIDPDHIIPPHAPMPDEAVQTAIANIEAYFPVIGLMERFDESLLLLQGAFGWKNVHYIRRNTTLNRPKVDEIRKATRDRLIRHCTQDLELYEAAVRRFDAQVAEMGEDFHRKLRRFRSNARVYTLTYQVYRKLGLQRARLAPQR